MKGSKTFMNDFKFFINLNESFTINEAKKPEPTKEEVENITIKGEFVIVVNNAVEQEDDTNNIDINYNKIITELLSDNVSSKDILKMMKALGLKRNKAYELINQLQNK